VGAAALNRWLFNTDTADKALQVLMAQGQRVAGGDRLGKTIIFARNHNHADFIVERFNRAWPHHKGAFARVIDSHDDYAQSLLDEFSERNKPPHIAVSVDMLDTGVDVPEVLNLVFFKPVFSKIKFQQMVGRGTRLCPDLLGPGQDKEFFLIFDLCGNFEFFGDPLDEDARPLPASLTTRVVRGRLELLDLLDRIPEHGEAHLHLRAGLLDALHAHVAGMTLDNFQVRQHRRLVEAFGDRQRWADLSLLDREEIARDLAALPTAVGSGEDPTARAFDLLCLKLQAAALTGSKSFLRLAEQVRTLAGQLHEKLAIPAVAAQAAFLDELQQAAWWRDVTLAMLEDLRLRVRLLVQFIDHRARAPVYTHFTDSEAPGLLSDVDPPVWSTPDCLQQYRRKVERWVRDHQDHLVIARLRHNKPLTPVDLAELERLLFEAAAAESRERLEEAYGAGHSLPAFIRGLVGLDREAAKAAFARYLEGQRMGTTQMRFIELIIDTLTQNGAMDPGRLYEPPFTDLHAEGLDGLFDDDAADDIVRILREVNTNGGVSFAEVAG
jgi:type I restriction enzyme R subunit